VLVTGAQGRAGRLDHLLIDPDARRRCSGCRRGCVSAYLTNSAIVAGLRDRYAAISQYRNPANGPVTIDVEPFEFTEWARAGAILAIRSYLAYGTHRNSPDPDRTRCVDSRKG
jgi:predicted NBD/HSP70 family sugar kinase